MGTFERGGFELGDPAEGEKWTVLVRYDSQADTYVADVPERGISVLCTEEQAEEVLEALISGRFEQWENQQPLAS